jgi:phosphohistidine phosphatase
MKTLGLYRHAKSDWHDPRARDFDRPLNRRGQKGAVLMGRHINGYGLFWDRIIASPAVRVAQTIELGSEAANINPLVRWDRRIYLASSATLLDLLREQEGNPRAILMVGHNPGLEDLIFDLVPDDGSSPLRDIVEVKFPTAAFAVLKIDIADWSDLAEGSARLVHLTRPRDLDPKLGPEPADQDH